MKKISAKRVFAIIGIVLGSTVAFVGAVVGVMAAMGKFKTPVVFPTELAFLNQDQIVVETVPYDTSKTWEEQFQEIDDDKKPEIKSIELQGINPGSKDEVNRKTCYVWFYQNIGVNLITLCDENGQPLAKDNNNRYKVNCNEPIYYMVNKIDGSATTDGKVMLMARSENNKSQVDIPLTFWIDRSVESVFVDTTLENIKSTGQQNNQSINVGVDIGFDFKYLVETPLSLNPIVGHSNVEIQGKNIELYYVATGYSTDYIKVTEETIADVNSPLNAILTCEEGVFKFKSADAGEHSFKIAVFPTYADKLNYEASIDGLTIDNPNYHRTQSMKLTTLNVNVQNIDISEAGLLGSNVVLNLYSENDYITLDGVSGVDGAKDNNLELYMKKGTGANIVADYTRFDEVTMDAFRNEFENVWADNLPKFVAQTADGEDEWIYDGAFETMLYELSGISLNKNLQIINYFYQNTDLQKETKYYCANGVAVLDNNGTSELTDDTVKLLKAGSYLNFYTKEDNAYNIVDFDYEIVPVEGNQGRTKSWQIITKEIPQGDLCLGILVVNNNGQFIVNKYFDTISVAINEVALNYTIKQSQAELNVEFLDGGITDSDKMNFEDFVTVGAGSYDAVLFVTEESANGYVVATIPKVKFNIGGKPYVLVGNVIDQQFENVVEVMDNLKSNNSSCELRVLQLKNQFKQSAFDIINSVLADLEETPELTKTFADTDENNIIHSLIDEKITINSKYILNPSLLEFAYDEEKKLLGETYSVYENTTNHQIVISSSHPDMIDKIVEFYGIDEDLFDVDRQNIIITGVSTAEAGKIILTYEAKNCLSDPNTKITISLNGAGAYVELPTLKVLSGSPDEIVLNVGVDGIAPIVLANNENSVTDKETLVVDVAFVDGAYVYTIKYADQIVEAGLNIFNTEITLPSDLGFQSDKDKGQSLAVSYETLNKSIVDISTVDDNGAKKSQIEIKKDGETVVAVTIGETVRYFKIKVDASKFELTTHEDKTSFDFIISTQNKTFNLNNNLLNEETDKVALLTYNNLTNIPLNKDNFVYINNVKCIYYGDGILTVAGNSVDGWELKKGDVETPILTIKDNGNGWEISKSEQYVSLTISFDIETINGSKNIVMNFSSNVTVDVNSVWNENREFYAGTTVLLYAPTDETAVPVIKSSSNELSFKINGNEVNNEFEVKEDLIGQFITIEVLLNGSPIRAITDFVVKPNIIAKLKLTDLKSETTYDISGDNGLFDLKSYDTSVVYGRNGLYYEYDGEKKEYKRINLIARNAESLNILTDNQNAPILTGGSTLIVGEMEELAVEKIRTITLTYNYSAGAVSMVANVLSCEIVVSNIHNENDKNVKEINSLKEYDLGYLASVTGFELTSVYADNLTFKVEDGKVVLTTPLIEVFEDVEITLTFTKISGTQTLKYTIYVDVVPYVPDERTDVKIALSGLDYDLLNGIYNADTSDGENYIVNNSNIKSLIVTAIKDQDGNDITESVVDGHLSGYTQGQAVPNCSIALKEIKGDKVVVFVEYTITYVDNSSFVYPRKLEIQNRQKIEVFYPENDLELPSSTFKFLTGYEEDGAKLSNSTISADGIYTLQSTLDNPIHYEPVMIYTDNACVLDFNFDGVKKISRVNVENRKGVTSTNDKVLNINLIAYQTFNGMDKYAAGVITDYDTNKISLPASAQGLFGSLIFKLETTSGNYEYYIVYVYSAGNSDQINIKNNLNVIAYKEALSLSDYTNKEVATVEITSDTTYLKLLEKIGTDNPELYIDKNGSSVKFSTLFGKSYSNTTSLYLYNVSYAGMADQTENAGYWKKIKDGDKVVLDEHFNVITLGLLYQNGIELYVYGTITIYVQPTTNVSVNKPENVSNVIYELPNGEFVADIASNAISVESPFGASWKAQIISVDDEAYDDETDSVYSTEGSVLNIAKRASKDVNIEVKYSYNGTIVFVNYTYKATIIPEAKTFTVGDFNKYKLNSNPIYDSNITYYQLANGSYSIYTHDTTTWDEIYDELYVENPHFDNVVYLKKDAVYNSDFFGTYMDDYSIEIVEGDVYVDEDGTTADDKHALEFKQTTAQNVVKVKIIYNNYSDEDTAIIFTFVVKAGLYFEETKSSTSGLTTSNRKKTELKDEAYVSNVGSTLSIDYQEIGVDLFKYQIGGLTIYTNKQSTLTLAFDVNSYVIDGDNILDDGKNIVVSGSDTLEFAHSAQEVSIKLSIDVKANSNSYNTTKDFFITVIQTYSKLNAVYCVEGADHENVPGYIVDGTEKVQYKIENLHDALMGSTKFELLGTQYDEASKEFKEINETYILTEMGFTTEGNPNYIEFSVGGNATIKGNKDIVFNQVTKNTLCYVYLNNQAGMEKNAVWYTYQIMASENADGLNLSTTNGYHAIKADGTEYLSFLMGDTDQSQEYTSDLYIVGSMLDEINYSIFDVSINGILSATPTTIVDGKASTAFVDKKGKTQTTNGTEENDYVNAIQYNFVSGNYSYYLTYDLDINRIELLIKRSANKTISQQIVLALNIGGVNGEKTILSGFEVVLSNYQISSKYADTTDATIYAGYNIDLTEKITGDADEITYTLAASDYTVDGKLKTILAGENDNNLFKFTGKKLQTKAVGSDVRATVNLIAYANNYALKQITYNFLLRLNMQFVVNGDKLTENIGNTSPETNFVLTTDKDVDGETGFPIAINFIAGSKVVKTGTNLDTEDNYYRVLAFDLYNLKIQGNDTASDNALLIARENSFKVELYSNIDNGVLTVSDSGIIFHKDYSGDIELKLSAKTGNGTYYVIWTIHVSGIKNQTYVSKDPDYARMQNNSLPFISGTAVDIMNTSTQTGTGVAIKMENASSWAANTVSMNIKYNYVINTFNSDTTKLSNKTLFGEGANLNTYQGGVLDLNNPISKSTTSNKLSINLPSVPSTTEDLQQSYLVTYRLYVEYLGLNYDNAEADDNKQEVQVFYVSYRVINYQQVKNYNYKNGSEELSSADINVNADLTNNKLDLFYYTVTDSTQIYAFAYAGGKLTLSAGGTNYTYDESKNESTKPNLRNFVDSVGSIKYSFDIVEKSLYNSVNNKVVDAEDWLTTSYYAGKYSVFSSEFTNIFEYKDFIDRYLNINNSVQIHDNEEDKKYNFKLTEIVSGRYGIDLSTQFSGENKFKNELCAELKMMVGDVATVTVPAYSADNKNGFRLTTSEKIIANTRNGAGVKLSEKFS